jgi:hypothetical protein
MFPFANINFFLNYLTKTYLAVLMPSKVVPQILESFFWLRSFAESRKHAMVRIGFFDFSPGLELGCLLGAPARGISSHN